MYNAYAEPQNYFDYDYVDYQSASAATESCKDAFLPDVPYASSRAFVPNPMQSFSGYSTQSDTSVSSTNPFNPSQLTSSNHADDEASSPLAAGRYESPDMVYHSDNDYTGAQAPADYARSGLSQHCYKSSHGSFQRDDSDDASYHSHHSHHSHNPQALRLSSSPSRLQPVRASLSPPRRSYQPLDPPSFAVYGGEPPSFGPYVTHTHLSEDDMGPLPAAYTRAEDFFTPEHFTPDYAVQEAQPAFFAADFAHEAELSSYRQPLRAADYASDYPTYSRDYTPNYSRDYTPNYSRDYTPSYSRDYTPTYSVHTSRYAPDYDRSRYGNPVFFRGRERVHPDLPAKTPTPPLPAKSLAPAPPAPPSPSAEVRERVEQALRWRREGDTQKALVALERLQQSFPVEPTVRLELARLQAELGCFREVCATLRAVCTALEARETADAWSEPAIERLVRLEKRVGDRASLERVMWALLRGDSYRGVKTVMECGLHVAKLGGSFATQQAFARLQAAGAVTQGNLVLFQVQFLARFVSLPQAVDYLRTCVVEYPKHGPLWFTFFYLLEHQEMMLWDGSDMSARIRAHELVSTMASAVQSLSAELRWKVFYVAIQMLLRTLVHLRLIVHRRADRLAEYSANTTLGQRACGWYFRVLLPLCPPNLRWKCWLLAGRASMLAGNRRAAREVRIVCEYES